uniref:acetyl-CoA carboxylase carboxyltransferase beta subunit n=1 Tax=Sclerocactus unguispinus TaxID=1001094 RepID=UPI0030026D5E|nr:acetyl-CoA carboxylase carboxyltransferase beta subunit [Sclerocactus unguispinus]
MSEEETQKYRHLWVQCENCYGLNYKKYFFNTRLNICEHCGFNLKMNSLERIELPIDQGTWNPMDEDMISTDPIEFDRNPTKKDPIEFYVNEIYAQINEIPAKFYEILVKIHEEIFISKENTDSMNKDHILYPRKRNKKLMIYIHFCKRDQKKHEHHICLCKFNKKKRELIYHYCKKKKETKEETNDEETLPAFVEASTTRRNLEETNDEETLPAFVEASTTRRNLEETNDEKTLSAFVEASRTRRNLEDSKNPIACHFTYYADGTDLESASKEENCKEEEVSEDFIDFGSEEKDYIDFGSEEKDYTDFGSEEKDYTDFVSEEKDYIDRIDSYQEETGLTEAVQTGTGQLNSIPVAIGVMDFQFIGGSMGSVVGEKITRLIEYATKKGLPVILVCASGGARMQEGSLSLMQMAKISAALHKHQKNKKLLYISILTSPTTGGVTASFGMLGDIIITEPDAEIAFAGKRVIEQTLHLTVPEDLQTSENLFQKGLFDLIVPRNLLKKVLSELLKLHTLFPSAQLVK